MADEKKSAAGPDKAPASPKKVTGFACGSIKAAGNRYQFGDVLELDADLFAELEANGLVSKDEPVAPGDWRRPPKGATECKCECVMPLKYGGELHKIGDKVTLPADLYCKLAPAGVVKLLG